MNNSPISKPPIAFDEMQQGCIDVLTDALEEGDPGIRRDGDWASRRQVVLQDAGEYRASPVARHRRHGAGR
jgi:hypothetical protein